MGRPPVFCRKDGTGGRHMWRPHSSFGKPLTRRGIRPLVSQPQMAAVSALCRYVHLVFDTHIMLIKVTAAFTCIFHFIASYLYNIIKIHFVNIFLYLFHIY